MATSGSFKTSTVTYTSGSTTVTTYFLVSWNAEMDQLNNRWKITTTVTQKNSPTGWTRTIQSRTLRVGKTSSDYTSYSGSTSYVGSNNQKVPYTSSDKTTITTYVNAEDNGTCTLYIYAVVGVGSGTAVNSSGNSGTITLDTIPRYSTITLADDPLYSGTTTDITVEQQSATYYSRLYWKYETDSDDDYILIGSGGGMADVEFQNFIAPTIQTADYPLNADYINLVFKAITYFDSTYTTGGLETVSVVPLYIPANVIPIATIGTITEANADLIQIENDLGITLPYIVGYSLLNIPVSFTGIYSSTLKGMTVQVGSEIQASSLTTTPQTFTTTIPLESVTNSVIAYVLDSRNRTDTDTQTVTAVSYVAPTLEIMLSRVDSNGDDDSTGTNLSVKAKWEYSSLNSVNQAEITFTYNGTNYTYTTLTNIQTTWLEVQRISGFQPTDTVSLDVAISDLLTSINVNTYLGKATVPLSAYNSSVDGIGVTLGLAATAPGFRITQQMYDDGNIMDFLQPLPVVAWTNPNPSSSFAAQTITLSEDMSNYDYYEIIFNQVSSATVYMSSGKVPVGEGCRLQGIAIVTSGTVGLRARMRDVTYTSSTQLTFDAGAQYTHNASSSTGSVSATTNTVNVPYQVLLYKI